MRYLIIIEKTGTGYSAYSPDLPGCVSTGVTREDIERNMQEAIELHLGGLREEGDPVPEPTSASAHVSVAPKVSAGRNRSPRAGSVAATNRASGIGTGQSAILCVTSTPIIVQ